ncbi:hypothetical protein PUNSTDRAFT_111001 [Punctularia strigosozonata HHB-11173 SS5]|uniref:uncharacterized protein n=1 Tax=Punctularia strigosozonata (strain HHB-11173) TaxID=741275 RepID=UPI0004417144|nr:uncharacterized protein PUNSTDRAFT_111001 [Punctularia strigosozonata HHB-11173 SS5]EIN12554.1 hypothetical protein PUNSTDRAFT_111001 [Punctularia strigosozonata HHB-11173 SS5]
MTSIRVVDLDNGDVVLGYVNMTLNEYGEYGIATDVVGALGITLPANGLVPSDLAITGAFPALGGVVGLSSSSSNLGSGSYNFVYLAGTPNVPAGPAVANQPSSVNTATGLQTAVSSAFWTYDAITGLLSAHWVNTDGSDPVTEFVYYMPDNVICLTGDVNAFRNYFGEGSRVALQVMELPNTS